MPALPWSTFIRAHMETMIACDFFTKTVFTLRGPRTARGLILRHAEPKQPPLACSRVRPLRCPAGTELSGPRLAPDLSEPWIKELEDDRPSLPLPATGPSYL
jgi:hypothetical protein